MRDMKIVIIDDNSGRRELIKKYMPDYAITFACGFGEVAKSVIMPESEGGIPDIVIINGDDAKGFGLYTFDWMRTKSDNEDIMSIPVIVLTEDEFSDRSLDFLEIDDVAFYEGEVEEDRIYSAIMDTLFESDFAPAYIEPSYTDEKSYDKISGQKVKPSGGGGKKRSVVLNMDSKLQNLEAALERGRQKSERIKELLEAAQEYKENRSGEKKQKGNHFFLNKIRVEKGLEARPIAGEDYDPLEVVEDEGYDEDDIPEEFRLNRNTGNTGSGNPATAANSMGFTGMNQGMNPGVNAPNRGFSPNAFAPNGSSNVFQARTNQGFGFGMNNGFAQQNTNFSKKKIVIVDDDESDRRMCETFLSSKYEIVLLDSGMKAIDYFVRNKADLMILDTYMPNLGGVQTLASVRWQTNGKEIPVIYMVDKRFPVSGESLAGPGVVGVIQKPVSAGSLSMSVDGFFRRRR